MTKNPYPSRRDLMTAAATLAAVGPARGLTATDQAAPAPAREASQEMVKGVVFETRTGTGQRQADDRGLAGVLVSNGREVVRTGPDGGYSLPIEDGMAVFVIKPTGYAVERTTTLRRATDATSLAGKELARNTATAAYNINNATSSLLKWAGVTSIVGGVLGLGGLTAFGVGIDLFGASVSAQRTTSMGLGTSIGGLQAARTNFGRFGNVEGMLERMQQAKTDVNMRIGLRNLGFTDKEIDENSSNELLAKALPRLRTFAKEHQRGGMLTNWLQSKAIPFSAQEAQTLAGAEPGEVEGLSQQFFKNKKEFEPSEGVAKKWQDFTTRWRKLGEKSSGFLRVALSI